MSRMMMARPSSEPKPAFSSTPRCWNPPHDLYSKPFTLELKGDINFFDDGRMQIEQRNTNRVPLTVNIESLGNIPLEIPAGGVYLNFLSNPIKEIPAEY